MTDVIAVVADLNSSTKLGLHKYAQSTASIYEAALRPVVDIFHEFGAGWIPIQGDCVVGLFWDETAMARAMCAGITVKTFSSEHLVERLTKKWPEDLPDTGFKVGVATSTVLVKRIGRPQSPHQALVWPGKALNYAVKSAQSGDAHEIVVTGSVWDAIRETTTTSPFLVIARHLRRGSGTTTTSRSSTTMTWNVAGAASLAVVHPVRRGLLQGHPRRPHAPRLGRAGPIPAPTLHVQGFDLQAARVAAGEPTSPPPRQNWSMTGHDGFIEGLLDETREEVSRADIKASILLASAGVTAAVLIGAVAGGDIRFAGARGVVQLLEVMAAVTFGLGGGFLGAAVIPQLGKPATGRARYFMEHAQYERLDELREALEREGCDPGRRHLAQLSRLSRTVRRKYRLTQAGAVSSGAGVLLAVAAAVTNQFL